MMTEEKKVGLFNPAHTGYIVGIDPGKEGALAVINKETGELVDLVDMPLIVKGKQRMVDDDAVADFIWAYGSSKNTVFVMEIPHKMPGQNVKATSSQWEHIGMLKGCFASGHVKRLFVSPQSWQKEAFAGLPKGDTKATSFQVAKNLFPNAGLQTARGRILDGRCDALLIAWSFYRSYLKRAE